MSAKCKTEFSISEAVGRGRIMSVMDDTMTKAAKYDKLMAELKAKLECPVCLAVPTEGQMLACPRGHLVCGSCRVKMTAKRQEDCPVCRELMGNNKSLLAMVVIENMEHECTNKGCKEKLPYKEVTKHTEELCRCRLIICPDEDCTEFLPLSSFNEHAKMCFGLDIVTKGNLDFDLEKGEYENGNASWKTQIFHMRNETFALCLSLQNNKFYLETLMLAERDKSDRFMTSVSILNPKSEPSYTWQINPTPMGPTDIQESIIVVHKTSLAKVFKTNQDLFEFAISFKVSEKRSIEAVN